MSGIKLKRVQPASNSDKVNFELNIDTCYHIVFVCLSAYSSVFPSSNPFADISRHNTHNTLVSNISYFAHRGVAFPQDKCLRGLWRVVL
jgi:hypothetical protein